MLQYMFSAFIQLQYMGLAALSLQVCLREPNKD